MLSRCPHCDRPFVATSDVERPRCPHCGKDTGEPAAQKSAPPDTPEPPAAVVAEGSQSHPPSESGGRRRHGVRPPPPRFEEGRPAFEQRERGLFSRFFGTLADACLRPVAFFTHLSREGVSGITWFAYVCVLLGTVGQAFWGLVSYPFVRSLLERSAQSLSEEELAAARAEDNALINALLDAMEGSGRLVEQLVLLEAQLWVTLLLAPVTAFFTIHLLAGLVHFSVQTFRPPAEEPVPYEVTYRFVVYSFAPMALGILPTLGSVAGLFSLVLLFIAVGRLHRVRVLGLVGGVLMPVLLLSWLWDQEALPRLAPPLAEAIGVVEPADDKSEEQERPRASDDEDTAAYPPMPPADRDHSVEVKEERGWLFTERTWDSSLGRLHIKQRVAKEGGPEGRALIIEVTNQSEQDIASLFMEHELPSGAQLADEDATSAAVEARGRELADISVETTASEGEVTFTLERLPAGAKAVLSLQTKGSDARALLDTAPAVGRAVLEVPPSDHAAESAP